MRQAGRYLPEYLALRQRAGSFLEFCFTPEFAVEATLQPIRRYAFDAAILFSDILVVPYALGQGVWFEEGRGPRLDAIKQAADLDRLRVEDLSARLRPVYAALEELRQRLPAETALIGFAGGPWTVATYMLEGGSSRRFTVAKQWMAERPAEFARLMDLLVDGTVDHLAAQAVAGAEVLQIFESWAGALPDDAMRRWSLGPLSEIVRRVKSAHPDIPWILFPRGAGELYRDFASESGADALSLDPSVSLPWAREQLQTRVTVQGNLDPQVLLAGGERLDNEVRRIVTELGKGPFIFNLGHGILPQTPLENVARLVRLVRERQD
jgi:uroporphyrinogen decarboxylase